NPEHADAHPIVSPLYTGTGATTHATASVSEVFLTETDDKVHSNGLCLIETPGGMPFKHANAKEVGIPHRMTQPDISQRLLTGAHPHNWNVLEKLSALHLPWHVNQV